MGDDPTSQLLHHTYLMTGDPSQRTAFPGDFAEFLSRSPTLSGSNCPTRHPPLTDPSPKLLFFFYRRSDKVWGMTPPPDFCTTEATRKAQLCTKPHFWAILRNSYQDQPRRRPGAAILGSQAVGDGCDERECGSRQRFKTTRMHSAETLRFGSESRTHASCLRRVWQVSHATSTL